MSTPTREEKLGRDVVRFVEAVRKVAARAIEAGLTTNPKTGDKKEGGWVGILLLLEEAETAFLRYQVGIVPETSRSPMFCEEKPCRVLRDGLLSSYENRSPKELKFGGGVRLNDYLIGGFSGFPDEKVDEAVVLLAAEIKGLIEGVRISQVLSISANHSLYQRLRLRCRDLLPIAA